MRVPGLRTASRLAMRVRQALNPGPIVLLYHRVVDLECDPWSLAVTPPHFAEQLEVIRMKYRPLSLSGLAAALRTGELPRRAVVITFDDGYNDNLYNAKPLLERFDCPATFFLATGALGGEMEFWWDELAALLGSHGEDYRSHYDELRLQPATAIRRELNRLRARSGQEPENRSAYRTLTCDEVVELASGGSIEIGAHTVTHPVLSAHPESVQRDEIADSKQWLEDLIGSRVASFSYPHGTRRDFSGRTMELVRETGYEVACAAYRGVVRRSTDPFSLPRIGVEDWDGDEFARQLYRVFD